MKFGEYDFRTFRFGTGAHRSRKDGMCVMEAVAYVAGERHSDQPKCACPVISEFVRTWNDGITDDARRHELLSPFVFRLPGTKAGKAIELRRGEMCLDCLVREQAPLVLETVPELVEYAKSLRGLPEITAATVADAVPLIQAARDAAWDAAWTAARDAAWDAARDAARAAAWAAAWAATGDAARDAARAAAWDAAWTAAGTAAWDAAWTAAWTAARTAARDAPGAVVDKLLLPAQDSAARLVDRMIRLTEPQEIARRQRKCSALQQKSD